MSLVSDTHGRVLERLGWIDNKKYLPEETALIILGDAGINFYLNKTDYKNKKAIQETGYTIYCVRGNHEERPENIFSNLVKYDDEVGNYILSEPDFPNIKYFIDGLNYTINGRSALVIGGAYSVDKWYRLKRAGLTEAANNPKVTGWFPDEQLNKWEMEDIRQDHFGKSYDIILTHTAPISCEPTELFIPGLDQSTVDKSMEEFLEEVKNNVDWKLWLCGHYHASMTLANKVQMLYYSIHNIEDLWNKWNGDEINE